MYNQVSKPQDTYDAAFSQNTADSYQKRKNSNPYGGTPLRVSGKLASRIKESFGINANELELRESHDVAELGARATAQGNAIRFAPGEFRPDTREGMTVLGHELNHVREQALGKVSAPGGTVFEHPGHEAASDRAGEAFASGGLNAAAPVSVGVMSAESAPVQGNRLGKFMRKHFVSKRRKELEDYYGYERNGLLWNLIYGYQFAPAHILDTQLDKRKLRKERAAERDWLEKKIINRKVNQSEGGPKIRNPYIRHLQSSYEDTVNNDDLSRFNYLNKKLPASMRTKDLEINPLEDYGDDDDTGPRFLERPDPITGDAPSTANAGNSQANARPMRTDFNWEAMRNGGSTRIIRDIDFMIELEQLEQSQDTLSDDQKDRMVAMRNYLYPKRKRNVVMDTDIETSSETSAPLDILKVSSSGDVTPAPVETEKPDAPKIPLPKQPQARFLSKPTNNSVESFLIQDLMSRAMNSGPESQARIENQIREAVMRLNQQQGKNAL